MLKIFFKLFIFFIFKVLVVSSFAQQTIILKIKPHYKTMCLTNNISLPSLHNILQNKQFQLKQLFPKAYFPKDTQDIFYKYYVDISTIYELQINEKLEINSIINKISSLPEVEYCHLKDIPELLYTTNDPAIGAQYYLNNVKAFDAWDIYKGDSTIVIGIIDTGTELAHDDLWQNIAYNYNDPIDGIDNDGDGFTDNFRGWDVGNNDNSAEWSENAIGANPHGVFVAGMAAPTTNNGIGIAGVGFNTKYLPVKIVDSTGILSRAYEGIVYAADHGCKIINCSWGSTVPTAFGYDIIRYATYNRKALVLAAAGNNGHTTNSVYYPAAYDEVVAVAATNQADIKWQKSCYGYHVDISAPGENVYSTYSNNGYTYGWGTSYASPLASSVAALVYGYYQKKLNPFQLRAIIEQNSDIIDTIQGNQSYAGMIGKGRVNAFKALTQSVNKALYLFNFEISENNDTSNLTFSIVNLFKPTDNLYAKIRTLSSCISFIEDSIYIGIMDSLQLLANGFLNFRYIINVNCPLDQQIDFFIDIKDNQYEETFHYRTTVNKSYADINNEIITLTACSNGRIGYHSLSPVQGSGIQYNQSKSLVSEMGLLLYDTQKASWCFLGKNDFKPLQKVIVTETEDNINSNSQFNDLLSINPLKINVHQNISLFKNDTLKNIVLIQYQIKNNSTTDFDSLYVGLFSDIDIINAYKNKISFDSLLKLQYTYFPYTSGVHMGFYLPDNFQKNYYAIDNDGANQSIKIDDGLSLTEIRQIVKQNRLEAGNIHGNDVSSFVSYGPIVLQYNNTINLNFLIIFGRNYNELITNSIIAVSKFDTTLISVNSLNSYFNLYPNPSANYFYLSLPNSLKQEENIIISVFDIQGKIIYKQRYKTKENIYIYHNFKKGMYIVQIQSEKFNTHYLKLVVN
jgi:hypothetical protein